MSGQRCLRNWFALAWFEAITVGRGVRPEPASRISDRGFTGTLLSLVACLLILGVTGLPLQSAQAAVEDEQDAPDSEIREFLKNPRGGLLNPQLSPLDEHLLGDRIDIESGSLSFHQVDVDIPGNSDLPVRFARKRARHGDMNGIARGWDIDIPYISVRVPENHDVPGYENLETAWMAERCSGRVTDNGKTLLSP